MNMISEPTSKPLEQTLEERTRAGNYFVSNYPPYSFWNSGDTALVESMLDRAPHPDTPLGVYVHIPFCRKRCHFCYFKVYTDKNASEVDSYIEAVGAEAALYAKKAALAGRKPTFIYFGGGTPSYISSTQLGKLAGLLQKAFPWDEAKEIAFECEPGTLTEGKLAVLKEVGITRLSLGIENFDEQILKANGRAHGAKEIDRAAAAIRKIGFEQLNIDLIAGMVGETWENWRENVRKTLALEPESVTIYQMEVPYNTTMFKDMKVFGHDSAPIAGWRTKRDWVDYAFTELEQAGYTIGSAYTAVRDAEKTKFLYRDALWHGADMLGVGVAAFSHVQGLHFQNEHEFDTYCTRVSRGELPLYRALAPDADERLIREFILQMKLGHVAKPYFAAKFGVDVEDRFAAPLGVLRQAGYLNSKDGDFLRLSRDGLLRIDGLLHEFFLPKHQTDRVV
jgi:oxygen-independent coproporphyrinogen III oxidase